MGKFHDIRWKSLTLPLQGFGAWRREKSWRTSLKCKTSWSFNNPMRYVFTLAIIVFSFCVFYLTTFQGPANLFHLLREWTMCLAQKQLPLSGCISSQKQSTSLNHSPGEAAVSLTVDTAVLAAVRIHTATAGVRRAQQKFSVEIYQCNSNRRERDESPTRKKISSFLKLLFKFAEVWLFLITILKSNKAS